MDLNGAESKMSNKAKDLPAKQQRWEYSGPEKDSSAMQVQSNAYPNITPSPLQGSAPSPNYNGSFENSPLAENEPSMQNSSVPRPKISQNFPNESQMAKQPMMEYQRPQYTLPGVLHFLQHEWTRFELDRAQWEVERAELQARVAFLQGERKSQESLKVDLVRRIKMLELALRQERQKFSRYKNESEGIPDVPNVEENRLKSDDFDGDFAMNDMGYGDYMRESPHRGQYAQNAMVSGISSGRHLLRQYLKEIGYTDTLINVRSARVRALLGKKVQGCAQHSSGPVSLRPIHVWTA